MYPYPNYQPYYNNRSDMLQQASRNIQPAFMPAPNLMGEMVTDFETVKTARVDMSGATGYYPTLDGKVIYTKVLMPDGTAQITEYRKHERPAEVHTDMTDLTRSFNALEEKFNALEEKFNSFSKLGVNHESNNNDRQIYESD